MKKYILMSFLAVTMLLSSCSKDFLTLTPTNSISSSIVFNDIQTIEMAIQEVYNRMVDVNYYHTYSGEFSTHIMTDLMSGTLVRPARGTGYWFTVYSFTDWASDSATSFAFGWWYYYVNIKNINLIIKNINFDILPESSRAQAEYILAEAKALRAFHYYRFSLLYSNRWDPNTDNSHLAVPLVLDPTQVDPMPRNTLKEVLDQVEIDFKDALSTFNSTSYEPDYDKGFAERMSADAVNMLLARLALYRQDYESALAYAKPIADKYDIMGLENYYGGFNDLDNPEWIFAAKILDKDGLSWDSYFSFMGTNFNYTFVRVAPMCIDTRYLDPIPNTDRRKQEADGTLGLFVTDSSEEIADNGIVYYYNEGFSPTSASLIFPGTSRKYRQSSTGTIGAGDVPYIRAAEAYYIVAEAAALTGDDTTAKKYLEATVTPYDATYVAPSDSADLLADIVLYKVFDMYGEGKAFEDFKRRGTLVNRSGSNHSTDALVFEYGPLEGQPRNDLWRLNIPRNAMNNNNLLVQN